MKPARPLLALAAALAALLALPGAASAQTTGKYPAHGYTVTLTGTGAFERDFSEEWTSVDGGTAETSRLDGSYSFSSVHHAIFVPTVSTSYRTQSRQSSQHSLEGTLSTAGDWRRWGDSGEPESGAYECGAPFRPPGGGTSSAPLGYAGLASGGYRIMLAPAQAAHQIGIPTCTGDEGGTNGRTEFVLGGQFDFDYGGLDPSDFYTSVTVSRAQLDQARFSVPVSVSRSGGLTVASPETGEAGPNCYGVPDYSDTWSYNCAWSQRWTGTLTFERVCSASQGANVSVQYATTDIDGTPLYHALGSCTGGTGTGGTVTRSLTLKYASKARAFKGALSAQKARCESGQPVTVWKQRSGSDLKLGTVTTTSTGTYKLAKPYRRGKYYSKVAKRFIAGVGTCSAAKSPTLTLK